MHKKNNKQYSLDNIDMKEIIKYVRENATKYFDNLGLKISENGQATEYLEACLSNNNDKECFGVLFLSCKHNLIKFEIVSEGTIDMSPVYPREIIKKALNYNAKSIILCHNHPSGDTVPSESDISITESIKKACDVFDVRCLDHIIIGKPGNSYSMAAEHSIIF